MARFSAGKLHSDIRYRKKKIQFYLRAKMCDVLRHIEPCLYRPVVEEAIKLLERSDKLNIGTTREMFGPVERPPSLSVIDRNLSEAKQTCLTRPSEDRSQLCELVLRCKRTSRYLGRLAGVICRCVNYSRASLSGACDNFPLVSETNASVGTSVIL